MIDWISVEDRLPEIGQEIMIPTKEWEARRIAPFITKYRGVLDGMTHWYPYNPPVKKRWIPKNHEEYYFIRSDGEIQFAGWESIVKDDLWRAFMGAYSSREEAEAMRDKIREFVSSIIGGV